MATALQVRSQSQFLRDFIMARQSFDPRTFGVDMDLEPFRDLMVDEFNEKFRGQWTVDELCLHPREALQFCDDVRRKHGHYYLPDDVILRSIMQRRKNPGGN